MSSLHSLVNVPKTKPDTPAADVAAHLPEPPSPRHPGVSSGVSYSLATIPVTAPPQADASSSSPRLLESKEQDPSSSSSAPRPGISGADLQSLRSEILVSTAGYRTSSHKSRLNSYAAAANGAGQLHQRARDLASSILAHDVFKDGNGRTAILAIYKLYAANGMALKIQPHLIWATIAAGEDSTTEYDRNKAHLLNVLEQNTVPLDDPKAVKYEHAVSGVARLQKMRSNWAKIGTGKDRRTWKSTHLPTEQADVRRLAQAQRHLATLNKKPGIATKGVHEGDEKTE